MLLVCATYGSIRGAYKEHERTIWITPEDVNIRESIDNGRVSGDDIPKFIGYIGIAEEQNEFYSFKLSLVCAVLGIIPAFIAMFLYYKIYDRNALKCIRTELRRNNIEEDGFIVHF